ncbi:MAG: hypothetical protein MJ240_09230 [Kiritimatiellae bacterium]|nr:hypothetical protein [Kiritimatiellia bacterium]
MNMKTLLMCVVTLSGVCAFETSAKPFMAVDAPKNASAGKAVKETTYTLFGPYGIRIEADRGCEKGAKYVLKMLKTVYLPHAVRYYGDPFADKKISREYKITVKRNDGRDKSNYNGPSYRPGTGSWAIGLAKGYDQYEMSLDYLASSVLTVCEDANWASFVFYVNRFVHGQIKGVDPIPQLKKDIERGLSKDGDDNEGWYRAHAPMWAALEELRKRNPRFIKAYCTLKNARYAKGQLPKEISLDQMAALLSEVTGEDVAEIFKKHGVKDESARKSSN